MKHHQPRLQQRKNTKGEPGFWYYRKRIPADVLDVWTCGGTGKKEYVVSLRTRDERVARKRAALEHDKFLEILEFKRQEKRIRKSENQQRIDAHLRYEAYLKRMGAHPEQAPPAFDHDAVDRYREAVAVVKYGQIDGFTQSKFSGVEPRDQEGFVDNGYGARVSQEFTDGLYHAQQDLGLDVSIDRDGNEKITRNQQYYEIQKDIDFLEGKSSRQYAYLPDIPTLADAKEAYLEHVNKKPRAEAKRASEVKRVERLVRDFAGQLGDGSTSDGLSRSLETIRVSDADRFVQSLRRTMSCPPKNGH